MSTLKEHTERTALLLQELLRVARAHTDALDPLTSSEIRSFAAYALLILISEKHCGGMQPALAMLRKTPWETLYKSAVDLERMRVEFPPP